MFSVHHCSALTRYKWSVQGWYMQLMHSTQHSCLHACKYVTVVYMDAWVGCLVWMLFVCASVWHDYVFCPCMFLVTHDRHPHIKNLSTWQPNVMHAHTNTHTHTHTHTHPHTPTHTHTQHTHRHTHPHTGATMFYLKFLKMHKHCDRACAIMLQCLNCCCWICGQYYMGVHRYIYISAIKYAHTMYAHA